MATSFPARHTIMLLDDHEMVRHGMAQRLQEESDLGVIGSFATSKALFAALAKQTADVLVIDFMLGANEVDGINLIRTLKIRYPQCKTLVLSAHYTPASVALAIQAGSCGFLGKSQSLDEMVAAIRTVAAGRIYLHSAMAEELAMQSEIRRPLANTASSGLAIDFVQHASLSPREHEVLRCFLDGMSVNEIAAKFSRSANTISAQKQAAYRKLGVKNDSELFKLFNQLKQPSAEGDGTGAD